VLCGYVTDMCGMSSERELRLGGAAMWRRRRRRRRLAEAGGAAAAAACRGEEGRVRRITKLFEREIESRDSEKWGAKQGRELSAESEKNCTEPVCLIPRQFGEKSSMRVPLACLSGARARTVSESLACLLVCSLAPLLKVPPLAR
jgi:hypothetical protein